MCNFFFFDKLDEVLAQSFFFEELFHVVFALVCADLGGLAYYAVACELGVDDVRGELMKINEIVTLGHHCVVLDDVVLEYLWTDNQVVDYFDLAVGEEHEVEDGWAFEVAFDFIGDVVFVGVCLYDFLDDEGRVVNFHELWDVDDLIVIELEDEMPLEKFF